MASLPVYLLWLVLVLFKACFLFVFCLAKNRIKLICMLGYQGLLCYLLLCLCGLACLFVIVSVWSSSPACLMCLLFLFAIVVVQSSLLVCLLCFAFCLQMWFALLLRFAFCLFFVNKFMLFGFLSSSLFARFFRCCLKITLRFVYEPSFRVLGYRLFFIKTGHVCG